MTQAQIEQSLFLAVGHTFRRFHEAADKGDRRAMREALADLEDSARQARTELSKPRTP